jgi:N-acetylneuraminate synthase
MQQLTDRFAVPVGFSDHTPEIYTALAAVTLGARVIEKHYTLSRRLRGPDYHVSLEPPDLAALVDAVRKIEAALGSEKTIYPEEEVVRAWAHHSVVSLTAIPAGARLSETVLGVKRPGSGIPARHLGELYDRVAARDIPANRTLVWEDVQN